MNTLQLIPVTPGHINGQMTQMVDARLLHGFLEVRRDFSTWIKGRIQEFGFVENEDYLLTKTGEQLPSGTKWKFEYYLGLDMAKELAMIERTPRGRQARRYFIECERQLRRMQQAGTSSIKLPAVSLSRAQRQAINRQAWVDVAGQIHAEFHARREMLLRQYQEQLQPSPSEGAAALRREILPKWAI